MKNKGRGTGMIKQISNDIINKFEDELIHELVLKDINNDFTNYLVVDIKYLKEIQELYKQTYKAKSDKSEFRIISSYDIIDDKSIQIYVTDEYKDMIIN